MEWCLQCAEWKCQPRMQNPVKRYFKNKIIIIRLCDEQKLYFPPAAAAARKWFQMEGMKDKKECRAKASCTHMSKSDSRTVRAMFQDQKQDKMKIHQISNILIWRWALELVLIGACCSGEVQNGAQGPWALWIQDSHTQSMCVSTLSHLYSSVLVYLRAN